MDYVQAEEYRPSVDEEYMCERHLQYFRKRLLTWRRELETASRNILQVLKETTFRNPDALEVSAAHIDVTLDVTDSHRRKKLLEQIDFALSRIDAEEYGYCEITGDEIGLKRLLAHPVATLCVEMQEQLERMSRSSSKRAPIVCHI